MPWALITGPSPSRPTVHVPSIDQQQPIMGAETFGWRLPGPFDLCAGAGSHLPRLSEPRWRRTTPVHSLWSLLCVLQYRQEAESVSSRSLRASQYNSLRASGRPTRGSTPAEDRQACSQPARDHNTSGSVAQAPHALPPPPDQGRAGPPSFVRRRVTTCRRAGCLPKPSSPSPRP